MSAMTPVPSLLLLQGWHGSSAQWVLTVGITPKRFRIRAVTRTRLAGPGRWLEPGAETLVPKSAVRHETGLPPQNVQDAVTALRAAASAARSPAKSR